MRCEDDGKKAIDKTFEELFGIINIMDETPVGRVMDYTLVARLFDMHDLHIDNMEILKEKYAVNLRNILRENKKKRVLDGVIELLEKIDSEPTLINAILTSNFKVGADAKLESVGIKDYFKFGGYGDEPGEKWDRLEEILADRNIERERIFLIGDGRYDIESAKKAKIKSIAVATGWTDSVTLRSLEPDYFVPNLSDTKKICEIIGI